MISLTPPPPTPQNKTKSQKISAIFHFFPISTHFFTIFAHFRSFSPVLSRFSTFCAVAKVQPPIAHPRVPAVPLRPIFPPRQRRLQRPCPSACPVPHARDGMSVRVAVPLQKPPKNAHFRQFSLIFICFRHFGAVFRHFRPFLPIFDIFRSFFTHFPAVAKAPQPPNRPIPQSRNHAIPPPPSPKSPMSP